MRTFHIGGTATRRAEQSHQDAQSDGEVRFLNVRTVEDREERRIAMNRNGEMAIYDATGRERERYPVVYGAHVHVQDGQHVTPGTRLLEWDPFSNPILAEVGGTIKFGDILEGVTMQEQVDEATGMSSKVITESKDPDMRPRISIKDAGNATLARALLPVNAHLAVAEGIEVSAGDMIAKIPRETTKTKDITGGLPRVAELFEARKPKEFAIVTEINGTVSFGSDVRGKRRVIITPEVEDAEPKEYLIPKGKHISVHEGDHVRAGEALMDGSSNPHDILRIKGDTELAKYLVDEVQEVYRLQGVKINDKHIETIVRQMLRRVRVKEVGDTDFLVGEQVERGHFDDVNLRMIEEGKQAAVAEPLLLGITKASLSTDSFISAASFQETTKVLTEAAIWGKTDALHGLKENVIMGRLVPAGTGMARYQNVGIQIDAPEELLAGPEEEEFELPAPVAPEAEGPAEATVQTAPEGPPSEGGIQT
jgi:DNA-directed RNA polymerase subunit beta'